MRGEQFLRVADELGAFSGEEWDRTRIGRLYYGVYLEYRAFAEDRLGFNRLNLAREHRVVADLIRSHDSTVADDLTALRILRNQADYDLDIPAGVMAERVATAEPLARSLMQRLVELRASS